MILLLALSVMCGLAGVLVVLESIHHFECMREAGLLRQHEHEGLLIATIGHGLLGALVLVVGLIGCILTAGQVFGQGI